MELSNKKFIEDKLTKAISDFDREAGIACQYWNPDSADALAETNKALSKALSKALNTFKDSIIFIMNEN